MPSLEAELAKALPGSPQVDASDAEGFRRVRASWPNGAWAKLDVHPDRVYWYGFNGPGSAKLLEAAHKSMPKWAARAGIHRFECAPLDHTSEALLKTFAPWEEFTGRDGDRYLFWEF
jgi:hypothetical protein